MANKRIFLSLSQQSGWEQEYVQQALETHWITSGGPNVDAFEEGLENYFGNEKFVTALNSGTSAIHLALILLGVKAGDEVICQSLTFSASANPILYQGATPVFVDSESDTGNICPTALAAAIEDRIAKGKKPKAIIAVHLYGMPYKVQEIHSIAAKYEIPIIEDAAEALGSSYKGRSCGTLGTLGVLSFNGNKMITTSAGGALLSDSKVLKEKAIFYATQSREATVHYEHRQIGYNYRMSNICAGIGLGQLKVLDANITKRRENHLFYKSLFETIEAAELFEVPHADFISNYWLNTILVKTNTEKKRSREALRLAFEKANIESRPFWKPMHLQPVFSDYPYYGKKVAEDLFEKGLCLPSGSHLTEEDKNRIKEVIVDFFK
ncbi:pyridoxal phosphate-dependent aminotransferase [Flavobacterium sp. L1I52]|uniref:Pyridoxal phosphate-dependent aminotransferase n=1 Tax=Flavobacterium pokkalii TaxID=1940408 RepID=A0ABR7UUF6_9FLAO|nr:aminotransferase class I/II-fold pyridoxal phosphate-dependent enzyme [Flavobacterium pokkalii]MBD0726542.1 pyridoxal phosphate-dependent aminotransferase [Flavobacterium pokkalii]